SSQSAPYSSSTSTPSVPSPSQKNSRNPAASPKTNLLPARTRGSHPGSHPTPSVPPPGSSQIQVAALSTSTRPTHPPLGVSNPAEPNPAGDTPPDWNIFPHLPDNAALLHHPLQPGEDYESHPFQTPS